MAHMVIPMVKIPMGKTVIRPEAFIYIALCVFTVAFLLFNSAGNNVADTGLAGHYVKLGGIKMLLLLGLLLALLAVMTLIRGIAFLIRAALHNIAPSTYFSFQHLENFRHVLLRSLKDLVFVGIPFILAFYSFALALEQLNIFNSTRLRDELVVELDFLLTHTFPPFFLASWSYPKIFIIAVVVCFDFLIPLLFPLAVYLFQKQQKIFREAAGAFFAGLLIMFAGWILFPVMSPHDRFIDNVYELPVPQSIQARLSAYHPQEEIAGFLEQRRKSKVELGFMPTSTLPSAHVAWGVFLVYYAWRVSRWWGLLAMPVALLSTVGTVLLAQHYFVDVPAGIAVALLSIVAARYAAKAQGPSAFGSASA